MKKLLLPLLLLIPLFGLAGNAGASCIAQDMAGTWVNDDANTSGITRVQINYPCNDIVLNGVPISLPDTIRVFGSCHPTDCNWGTANMFSKFWDERRSQYTYARANFNPGFKTSRLHIFLDGSDKLIISNKTQFHDGRDDYSTVATFSKR